MVPCESRHPQCRDMSIAGSGSKDGGPPISAFRHFGLSAYLSAGLSAGRGSGGLRSAGPLGQKGGGASGALGAFESEARSAAEPQEGLEPRQLQEQLLHGGAADARK